MMDACSFLIQARRLVWSPLRASFSSPASSAPRRALLPKQAHSGRAASARKETISTASPYSCHAGLSPHAMRVPHKSFSPHIGPNPPNSLLSFLYPTFDVIRLHWSLPCSTTGTTARRLAGKGGEYGSSPTSSQGAYGKMIGPNQCSPGEPI